MQQIHRPFSEEEKALLKEVGFPKSVEPKQIDDLINNSTSVRCAGMNRTEFLKDLNETMKSVEKVMRSCPLDFEIGHF